MPRVLFIDVWHKRHEELEGFIDKHTTPFENRVPVTSGEVIDSGSQEPTLLSRFQISTACFSSGQYFAIGHAVDLPKAACRFLTVPQRLRVLLVSHHCHVARAVSSEMVWRVFNKSAKTASRCSIAASISA